MRTNLDEMASNVSYNCSVDREICVRATFIHSAIENYSTGVYYASLTTMFGVSRNKMIRNEIDFHDYLA